VRDFTLFTPQYTATHCNTLQNTTTHCKTLQHTHCQTLQHTATYCNALLHTHIGPVVVKDNEDADELYSAIGVLLARVHNVDTAWFRNFHMHILRRHLQLEHVPRGSHAWVFYSRGVCVCVAGRCRVLQCIAVGCSMLQCGAVRCNGLRCDAVCCSVL